MNNPDKPKTLIEAISETENFSNVISERDMQKVGEELRDVVNSDGLGVALLVAWRHGLAIEHVFLQKDLQGKTLTKQVHDVGPEDESPYVFVHVPVRVDRGNVPKLTKDGIMNANADPAWFIYHEDSLIGTFSFPKHSSITESDVAMVLASLEQEGVLVGANINNRQIQFKDMASKKMIEGLIKRSNEKVYVRAQAQADLKIDGKEILLPTGRLNQDADIRKWFQEIIKKKSQCNYCSVQTLNPREATIHSALPRSQRGRDEPELLKTERNYQFGFTYAPFGDPRKVCHFLAWDFPHITDLVMNMDPQSYSFSDLIRLITVINRDITVFAKRNGVTEDFSIAGICNHWGGNSIYHQHYQFFHIPVIPLLKAELEDAPLTTYHDVVVKKYKWKAPAYLITSADGKQGSLEDIMFVADRVAKQWQSLNKGTDPAYGNGIKVKNQTQNIFVSIIGGAPIAVFIPRHRSKLSTSHKDNKFQKTNAGTLEMMGYFLIDELDQYTALQDCSPIERAKLGGQWLSELAVDSGTLQEFETSLHDCLDGPVVELEKMIEEAFRQPQSEAGPKLIGIWKHKISGAAALDDRQKSYLRKLINDEWSKRTGEDWITDP